ncbi:MAG: cupin domain-containing protein [Caldiserica bacterium]|nr:cupin domain-containing protein [Caldisericota bacterium]MDH7562913.1 cupin domain-containing protein [Caldisericota bacterium]
MKIVPFWEVQFQEFQAETVQGVKGRVLIGKDDGAGNFCMRFFELSPGGFTPRHSHPWEHEIFIHKGQAEVLKDGGFIPVLPGTALFVPGGEEHQIRNPGDEPLQFVCLIPSGVPEL